MASFDQGSRDLAARVGKGTLTALVRFPGPSSAALERGYWVSGPNAGVQIHNYHGGDKHFLVNAIDKGALRTIARGVLQGHGASAAYTEAEAMSARAQMAAPIRTGLLRSSPGHAVIDDGVTVRERPAFDSSVAPYVHHPRQSHGVPRA